MVGAPMTTPTTAAGRALLAWDEDATEENTVAAFGSGDMVDIIKRIEAEAAAPYIASEAQWAQLAAERHAALAALVAAIDGWDGEGHFDDATAIADALAAARRLVEP